MMSHYPPKYLLKLLRWFCKDEILDEVEGDLIELFEKRSGKSVCRARWLFFLDVIRSFRLSNLKTPGRLKGHIILMESFFKTAFRNIRSDRKFSGFNIFGLSVGLAVFIFMIGFISHENDYDKFHSKSDRLFEVVQVFENADGADPEIFTSLKLAQALKGELSIVEDAVTIHGAASTWAQADGERFFEENGIVAGKEFFRLFDFKLVKGSPEKALAHRRSIVIDEKLEKKYFGQTSGLGKIIELQHYGKFTVTGILETLPSTSTIQFNYIITQDYDLFFTHVAPWFPDWFVSWEGDPATTFVLLRNKEDAENFSDAVLPILQKNLSGDQVNPHHLLALNNLHFGSNGIDGRVNQYIKGNRQELAVFSLVASLILIMTCFNFMSLMTARMTKRSREVGVRKSMGAFRFQIVFQFLTEAFLSVFLAFVLSIIWISLLVPHFNELLDTNLQWTIKRITSILPLILVSLFGITLFTGIYPALHLSRFSPVRILRGGGVQVKGKRYFQNGLVTLQYSLVLGVLSALLIIHLQFNFITNKDLGFNEEKLMVVEINGGGVRNNFELIKAELLTNPNIKSVTGLTRMISGYRSPVSVFAADLDHPEEKKPMRFYGMDDSGLNTLGLELESGRWFSGQKSLDSSSVLLNEKAAKLYGGNEVLGKWIQIENSSGNTTLRSRVKGIIKDFHYSSLHDPIGPLVIGYYLNPFESLDDIAIRFSDASISETVEFVETVHNAYDENDVMTWEFLEDMRLREYQDEIVMRRVFLACGFIVLLIAIFGLTGLLSYQLVSRTKELGIRKVLGASVSQLLIVLGRSFLKMFLIGALICMPFVWWLMHEWVNDFAYRIDVSPAHFLGVLSFVFGITTLIIVLMGFKVANQNPVNSLRYE